MLQLGMNDTTNRYNPVKLAVGSGTAVSGAVGAGHTLVLTSGGRLYAFGDNRAGQCGVNSKVSKNDLLVFFSCFLFV